MKFKHFQSIAEVKNEGNYISTPAYMPALRGQGNFTEYLPGTSPVVGSSVGIATGYGLDGPGIESRWGGEIFRTCPDRPWGPLSLLYNGYRVFPGAKDRPGRDADPSPLLVPWSRKSRATPLLPLWAVRPVQSLSACTRVHFTFTFTFYS